MALLLGSATLVQAAPKAKNAAAGADAAKKQKEIGDGMQKQMDWESKLMGPNNEKKIDLAKIQKLQAEEIARREKQDKLDKDKQEKKDREASLASQRKDVKQPSTHEVPTIEETIDKPPPKPAEKHDDAFVDKLLKNDKAPAPKKKSAGNDEVDQLLAKAKEEKPNTAKTSKRNGDTVDQLLAAADRQPTIKTVAPKPAEVSDPMSAEVAAREATRKALAASAASRAEDDKRSRRPVIPDAAMLRTQQSRQVAAAPPPPAAAPAPKAAPRGWSDPFASEGEMPSRSRVNTSTTSAARTVSAPAASRRTAAPARSAPAGNDAWEDPFDSGGGGAKRRAPAPKAAPAAKPAKPRPASWSDPFA